MTLQYHDGKPERRSIDRSNPVPPKESPFISPVDREEIFRELICEEIRYGRLNKSARARVIRYACGMGLSALQAGKLVESCTEDVARNQNSKLIPNQLQTIPSRPQPSRISGAIACAIIIAATATAVLLS